MSQYKLIRCNINGMDVEHMVNVRASLMDMLRSDDHLTSVKKGCEVGECGFGAPARASSSPVIGDAARATKISVRPLRKLCTAVLGRKLASD